MEVYSSDGKKYLWTVVDVNIVEETKDNGEIGPWEFDFILFHTYREVGNITIQ